MSAAFMSARQGPGRKFQALGRLKPGEMNQTEAKYAAHLAARQLAGEVLWFRFDAVNLRLADRCFYKGDFLVMTSSCEVEFHEVKGARAVFLDDAKVKVKVAAEAFPIFRFMVCFPRTKRDGGGWAVEEVG